MIRGSKRETQFLRQATPREVHFSARSLHYDNYVLHVVSFKNELRRKPFPDVFSGIVSNHEELHKSMLSCLFKLFHVNKLQLFAEAICRNYFLHNFLPEK